MRKAFLAAAIAALVLAGCGGDSVETTDETPAPGASATTAAGGRSGVGGDHGDHSGMGGSDACTPSGTTVSIVASNATFNTDCIAAPADQPFTLSYENKDTQAHNIVLLESHTATQVMFRADIFQGPATKTFTAGPFKAGTYAFHCEVHPSRMSGTFIVK